MGYYFQQYYDKDGVFSNWESDDNIDRIPCGFSIQDTEGIDDQQIMGAKKTSRKNHTRDDSDLKHRVGIHNWFFP
jgi:hypothetical protein